MLTVRRAAGTGPPLGPLVTALMAAGLVSADPTLSRLLPADLWDMAGMGSWPLRITPALSVAALVLLFLRRAIAGRWPGYDTGAVAALIVAAQLNGFAAGPFDVFDLALGAVFWSWVALRALDETRSIVIPSVVVIAALIVALGFAHLMVESPVRWFVGVFGLTRAALVALLVVNLLHDAALLRRAEGILVAVATLSALAGVVQFALAYFDVFIFTLIDPPVSAYKPTPIGFVMRASGFCVTAQHFSSFLLFALPFALWRMTEGRSLRRGAVVVLLFTGILVSWNFGAMLTALLIMLAFAFLRWPARALHLGLALAGIGVASYYSGLLALIYDLSFGDTGVAKGVSQRSQLFGLGLEKIARNPWVGTGPQGFAQGSGNFWHRPVHNAFFQAATELGLGGAVLLLAAFVTLLAGLAPRAIRPGPLRREAAILTLGLLAMLQLLQSEPNLDHSNTWFMLGFAQAVLLVARREEARAVAAPA